MFNLQIQWRRSDATQLAEEKYAHLFAVLRGDQVLYVGSAYRKDLVQVVAAVPGLSAGQLAQCSLYLGRVQGPELGSLRTEVVESAQQLLVYAKKPMLNEGPKTLYLGMPHLRVVNVGADWLPGQVRAEQGRVFQNARSMAHA